jgi:hypothetical protein
MSFKGWNDRQVGRGYRWVLQDNCLQAFPQGSSRRTFKWSFFLARTLSRLNLAHLQ